MNEPMPTPPPLPPVTAAIATGSSPSGPQEPPAPIQGLPGLVEALLRQPERLTQACRDTGYPRVLAGLFGMILAGALVYGLVVGTFSGQKQLWAAPVKVSLGPADLRADLPAQPLHLRMPERGQREAARDHGTRRRAPRVDHRPAARVCTHRVGLFPVDRVGCRDGRGASRVLADRNDLRAAIPGRGVSSTERACRRRAEGLDGALPDRRVADVNGASPSHRHLGHFPAGEKEVLSHALDGLLR